MSRGLPRLIVAGALWITLVLTAAQLFALSHVGFIVLNCFSRLTAPPTGRGNSARVRQQNQRIDDDEALTFDLPSRGATLPFSTNYPTRSAAALRRHIQSNTQATNQAANAGAVKKTITREEWNARLSEVQVDRE